MQVGMARASPPTASIRAMHPGMVVRPSEAEHENLRIGAPWKKKIIFQTPNPSFVGSAFIFGGCTKAPWLWEECD